MVKRFPVAPAHPERNCWGCDRYCSALEMQCGNGSERTQHPAELFGPDWLGGMLPQPGPTEVPATPHPGADVYAVP